MHLTFQQGPLKTSTELSSWFGIGLHSYKPNSIVRGRMFFCQIYRGFDEQRAHRVFKCRVRIVSSTLVDA